MSRWRISASGIAIAVAMVTVIGCTQYQVPTPLAEQPEPAPVPIGVAKELLTAKLMGMNGVVGIGVGECDSTECIKVLLVEKTPGRWTGPGRVALGAPETVV